MNFYKYHGAGNDFLIADNRLGDIKLNADKIRWLCHRPFGIGADGLMLLNMSPLENVDFEMEFFNPDGSGGMMCGNGARCIVAFAYDLGLPHNVFMAPDGLHYATVSGTGASKTVDLVMKDVERIEKLSESDYFLDTGTRHFVRFVDDPRLLVIDDEAVKIRHDARFAPIGTNVNIVHVDKGIVNIRTFEKGVEAETYACGTGVVAAAIASQSASPGEYFDVQVKARGGDFHVTLKRAANMFCDVHLVGPTQFVAKIEI